MTSIRSKLTSARRSLTGPPVGRCSNCGACSVREYCDACEAENEACAAEERVWAEVVGNVRKAERILEDLAAAMKGSKESVDTISRDLETMKRNVDVMARALEEMRKEAASRKEAV